MSTNTLNETNDATRSLWARLGVAVVGVTLIAVVLVVIGLISIVAALWSIEGDNSDDDTSTVQFQGALVLGPDTPQVSIPFESTLRHPESSIRTRLTLNAGMAPAVERDDVQVEVSSTSEGNGMITFDLDDNIDTPIRVDWTIQGFEELLPDQIADPILRLDQPADLELPTYVSTVEPSPNVIQLIVTTTTSDVELALVGSGNLANTMDDLGNWLDPAAIAPPPSCLADGCTFSIWLKKVPSSNTELHSSRSGEVTTETIVHEFSLRSAELTEQIDVAVEGTTAFKLDTTVMLDVPGSEIPAPVLLRLSGPHVRVAELVDGHWPKVTRFIEGAYRDENALFLFYINDRQTYDGVIFWVENESGGATRQVDMIAEWKEPTGSPSVLTVDIEFEGAS